MEVLVKEIKPSTIAIEVVVDKDVWVESQKKAFDKIAATVKVEGFRKGKAPKALIEKKVDQAKVYDEAINAILPEMFSKACQDNMIDPYTRPQVEVTKLTADELEIKFTVVTMPKVTLGKYKGLKVEKDVVSVSEEEIKEALDKKLADNASISLKEGEAVKGDSVVIDFEGFVDGVAFDGGKADNYTLELGSGSFIPGFEDQLIGKKAGDEVEVNVKFPEQYVPELAGKDAMFKVTVHEVKEKKLAELNDEFVVGLGVENVKTIEELKEHEKGIITARKNQEAANKHFKALVDLIASEAEVVIADEIIEKEVESMNKNLENQITQNGLTREQYIQITGQTEEKIKEQMQADAAKNLKQVVCLEQIGMVEGLEVTEEEIEQEFKTISEQYKMELAKVEEILGKDISRLRNELRQRKISKFIIDNNK